MANAPYGYRKTVIDRKPTLEIYEPEARFVQMMFSLYAQGFGCTSVARQVNALGAKPHRSAEFNRSSVNMILRNPTYIGKIVWDQKKHIRKGARGNPKHITIYQPPEKWTITDGLASRHRGPGAVRPGPGDHGGPLHPLQAGWHSKEPAGRTGQVRQLRA